jgi:hypothetical protein
MLKFLKHLTISLLTPFLILRDVPSVQISLVYRRPDLEFEPSISSIRSDLFKQISDLLGIPSRFSGIPLHASSPESFEFQLIFQAHLSEIQSLFVRIEKLLHDVFLTSNNFRTFSSIGDISEFNHFISDKLQKTEDFTSSFNYIYTRMAEIDQLPDFLRFDFIQVSYLFAKQSIKR